MQKLSSEINISHPFHGKKMISAGKVIKGLLFFLAAFLLPGCITVYEKYNFKSNGSGTMEYIIDMSEFYQMMASFSDSVNEQELQIDQSFSETAEGLKTLKDISNVQLTGNSRDYIFGIRYDFANPAALNEAMAYILHNETAGKEYIKFSRKNITRYSLISDEFSKEKIIGVEENEMDEGMLKEIFEKMKYRISMDFSRPVKSVTTLAEYSIDKNKLNVETTFNALLENNKVLETVIRLK